MIEETKILKEAKKDSGFPDWMPELLELFSKSAPDDDAVHAFAKEYDLDPHELEGEIYKLLHSFAQTVQKSIGKNNDTSDDSFDSKELEMGLEVEMEHTDNVFLAKLIVKDHLSELPDYYTRLKKMEGD